MNSYSHKSNPYGSSYSSFKSGRNQKRQADARDQYYYNSRNPAGEFAGRAVEDSKDALVSDAQHEAAYRKLYGNAKDLVGSQDYLNEERRIKREQEQADAQRLRDYTPGSNINLNNPDAAYTQRVPFDPSKEQAGLRDVISQERANRDFVRDRLTPEETPEFAKQERYNRPGESPAYGYDVQSSDASYRNSVIGHRTQPRYEQGEGGFQTRKTPQGLLEQGLDYFGYYEPEANPVQTGKAQSIGELESKQYVEDWFSNPETRRRLKEHQGLTEEEIDQRLVHGLLTEDQSKNWKSGEHAHAEYKPDTHGFSANTADEGFNAAIEGIARSSGQNVHDVRNWFNKEVPDNAAWKRFQKKNPELSRYVADNVHGGTDSLPHELIHATGFDVEVGGLAKGLLGQQKADAPNADYYSRPAEIYGNLFDIRKKMGVKPGQKLSKKQFQNLVRENHIDEDDFYKNYDPEKLRQTLNTVADNKSRERTLDELYNQSRVS